MSPNGVVLVLALLSCVRCVPTVYRMKDNNVLEADLVPISSTVIPLEVYKIGAGVNVANPNKRHKVVTSLPSGQTYKKFYYGNLKKDEPNKDENQ